MLTEEQLNALTDSVVIFYRDYQNRVLAELARRLAKLGKPDAADWTVKRYQQGQGLYKFALTELGQLNQAGVEALRDALEHGAMLSMRSDNAIYLTAGKTPLPLRSSPVLMLIMAEGLNRTASILSGLTASVPGYAQYAFYNAADSMQVIGGEFNYDLALRRAIDQAATDGINLTIGGRATSIDSAAQRVVLTAINSTSGKVQLARMDEMDCDLVQVSAHPGARNTGVGPANHEGWQGKIYSRRGDQYPDFVTETGYGTGEGLLGWNCRHSFWPYFDGVSVDVYSNAKLESYAAMKVKYDGKEQLLYNATQQQRRIERNIRHWKERQNMLKAAGLDSPYENEKVHQWQEVARLFSKQTGLARQRGREMIFMEPWTR